MRKIAIMQPTYLPWIGYFDLIDQVDRFVFLDSVQFSKRSWQQRNRIKGPKEVRWLTVPVLTKGRSGQLIQEVEIAPSRAFPGHHIETIKRFYSKAPSFTRYMDDLSATLRDTPRFLADLNIKLIRWFCAQMGIETEMIRSSSLNATGRRVELLTNICRSCEAESYLSPEGSRTYIEENNLFESNEIELTYHQYNHPEYHQLHGDFVPYLSVLDLILNEGASSLSIIRSGRA